jgi:hypothetical protein|tara:strand:- start:430 stop:849 length:420 start_codon:yes stop_codon:yes gene_type:complete
MNYRFSNRELLLIKLLVGLAIVVSLFYGTFYLSNEITKSKESLFFEVNKFNEKKQQLSQIKSQEINKNLVVSVEDFLKSLTETDIKYEQNGKEILITEVSSLDALQIITNIEINNVPIESFKLNAEEPSSIILSIKFNG